MRRVSLLALVLLAMSAAAGLASQASPPVLDGGALYPQLAAAPLASTGPTAATGQTGPTGPTPLSPALTQTTPGTTAAILPDGYAAAPAAAPPTVQQAIWAGNQLIGQPYLYGGGHQSFDSDGYDCSGTVSYALHGAGLLVAPLDSTQFETWGIAGEGAWITVYANATHAFIEIAGIRLDTSAAGDPGGLAGPRWRPLLVATTGYTARYPEGY